MSSNKTLTILAAAFVACGMAVAAEPQPASGDFTALWYAEVAPAAHAAAGEDLNALWYAGIDAGASAAATADFTAFWYPDSDDGALTVARVEPLAHAKR